VNKYQATKRILQHWRQVWAEGVDDIENKVKLLMDSGEFIFFFKYKDEIYGTGESGRLTFAQMKNPSDENTDGWKKEASFTACNLCHLAQNNRTETVFGAKELDGIDVIADKDEVISLCKAALKNSKADKSS
jgi:hypothetical protein